MNCKPCMPFSDCYSNKASANCNRKSSRDRPKSAPYLRLKNVKVLVNWGPFYGIFFEKSLTMPKKLKGGPFGIFQNPFCPKISKNCRWDPSVKKNFFEKKVSQSRKYSLAPLSFLNDIKILLRKLRIVRN